MTHFEIRYVFPADINAAAVVQVVGAMPAIVGSTKQIAWAEDIRAAKARDLAISIAKVAKADGLILRRDPTEWIEGANARMADRLANHPGGPALAAAIDKVFAIADARYWIDNRDGNIKLMLHEASK
jgi:hypothetical protein